MAADRQPTGSPQEISAAVQEVAERAQLIVREEIELAKTEITEKVQKLVKGAVVGAVAGVFVLAGLGQLIHGLSWLAYYVLPGGTFTYFWGFFLVAGLLFILGAVAGGLAVRFFRSGSPPKPEMAIEEAQRIRETVQGD